MNVKEKIKIFWKNFTENWLWVTIGVYTGTILMGWIEYFRGFLPLIGVVLPTFVFPLFLFGIYYIRKLNSSSFEEIFPKLGDFIESLDYNADENSIKKGDFSQQKVTLRSIWIKVPQIMTRIIDTY